MEAMVQGLNFTHTGPKQLLPIGNKTMSQYTSEDLKEVYVL